MIFFVLAGLLFTLVAAAVVGAFTYDDNGDFWGGFFVVCTAVSALVVLFGLIALFVWLIEQGVASL